AQVNAAWMLSSATVAVLLAATAFVAARVAALYRGLPVRWIWALATVVSIAIALLWLRPTAPQAVGRQSVSASSDFGAPRVVAPRVRSTDAATPAAAIMTPTSKARPPLASFHLRLPAIPEPVGRVLRYAWIAMSLGFLLVVAVASRRIRRERSRWQAREIADTPVLVSPSFGPALVGVMKPSIVVPEWVLSLDAQAQRAIVAHENEHRAAHDPALILLGLIAVVLMPWNPGLWMSWRGLRRAIELDCDERVVRRGIEGGEYARVLLHAWKTARGSWLPSTAFAERSSGLGARVEHLMRPEPRGRAMRTLLGTAVAAGFVFVACSTPSPQLASSGRAGADPYPLVVIDGVARPELPPLMRFTGAISVDTVTTPTYRILYHGQQELDTAARKLYPAVDDGAMMQTIDAPASVAHFGDAAKYGVVLYYTKKYREAGGAIVAPHEGNMMVRAADPGTPASEMTGRIYNNLFNGITLPAEREAQARTIIEGTWNKLVSLKGPGLAVIPLVSAAITERDARLRALLASETDRARFDQRANESRPGGHMPTIEDEVNNQYHNIFGRADEHRQGANRVDLAAGRQEQARAIIRTNINDELALYARAPGAWTSNYGERLAMRMKRDTDIRALLATDADREKYDKIAARLRDMVFKRG
ncbi:MAG: M56 family metallopeptidase, partial [Gemmatimonadota bacterium]|nr:M56 family metallopeptidase [Gemmatimonadota bacterium]